MKLAKEKSVETKLNETERQHTSASSGGICKTRKPAVEPPRLRSAPDLTSEVGGAAGVGGFKSCPGRSETGRPEDAAPGLLCGQGGCAAPLGPRSARCHSSCKVPTLALWLPPPPPTAQHHSAWGGPERSPSASCDVPPTRSSLRSWLARFCHWRVFERSPRRDFPWVLCERPAATLSLFTRWSGAMLSSPQSVKWRPRPWNLSAPEGRPRTARIFCPFMPRDRPAGYADGSVFSLAPPGGPAGDWAALPREL